MAEGGSVSTTDAVIAIVMLGASVVVKAAEAPGVSSIGFRALESGRSWKLVVLWTKATMEGGSVSTTDAIIVTVELASVVVKAAAAPGAGSNCSSEEPSSSSMRTLIG